MNSKNLVFILILLLSGWSDYCPGQDFDETPSAVTVLGSEDIFNKGVWNFNLDQVLNIQPGSIRQDGEKTGNYSNYNGRVEANYFFIDHVAVGAGIRFSGEKTDYSEIDLGSVERIEVIGGYGNVLYGNRIGGVVNIITKAGVGGGRQKEVQENGFGEYEEVIKYLTFIMSFGSPVQIDRNIYFTPSIGWEYRRNKGENFTEKRNGFNVGLNMDFYMGNDEDDCDLSDNPLKISERFRQGDFHMGSRMYGMFQTGTQKTTWDYQGTEYEQKDGFGNSRLSGYALYYLIDNLAVGLGADYSCDRTSSKDNDYKERQSELTAYPLVRYHVPVDNMLKNLYAEGSIGYGWNNSKVTDEEEEEKEKATVIDWKLGIGYNYYVSEHFSLSPMVGYGNHSIKYQDDDYRTTKSGLYAGIGWNYHLR